MQTVYEAAGGCDGLLRLASAWHTRVLEDEVVSHAFSHGYHPQHTKRLAAYWAEALGGPTTYSDQYGNETSVVRIHSGNGPHEEMDQRAIACFDQALEDVGLVQVREDGTRNVYSIRMQGFASVREFVDDFWDTALANGAAMHEAGKTPPQVCQEAADMLKKAAAMDNAGFRAYAASLATTAVASGHYKKCGR